MYSRPVNRVTSVVPRYLPIDRDAKQDKRQKPKKDPKAEPDDNRPESSPTDDQGPHIDTLA